jgi:hypothetical protein
MPIGITLRNALGASDEALEENGVIASDCAPNEASGRGKGFTGMHLACYQRLRACALEDLETRSTVLDGSRRAGVMSGSEV